MQHQKAMTWRGNRWGVVACQLVIARRDAAEVLRRQKVLDAPALAVATLVVVDPAFRARVPGMTGVMPFLRRSARSQSAS